METSPVSSPWERLFSRAKPVAPAGPTSGQRARSMALSLCVGEHHQERGAFSRSVDQPRMLAAATRYTRLCDIRVLDIGVRWPSLLASSPHLLATAAHLIFRVTAGSHTVGNEEGLAARNHLLGGRKSSYNKNLTRDGDTADVQRRSHHAATAVRARKRGSATGGRRRKSWKRRSSGTTNRAHRRKPGYATGTRAHHCTSRDATGSSLQRRMPGHATGTGTADRRHKNRHLHVPHKIITGVQADRFITRIHAYM